MNAVRQTQLWEQCAEEDVADLRADERRVIAVGRSELHQRLTTVTERFCGACGYWIRTDSFAHGPGPEGEFLCPEDR